MNQDNVHTIIGKDKYILVDAFGEGCIHCYHMVDTINKLSEYFNIHRKDIKVYKMDAGKNPNLSRRYRIQYYPTLLFFRPGDAEFPLTMVGRHDYNQVLRMALSFKQQKSVEELVSEEKLQKLCKSEVRQALSVYERELRDKNLLLTQDKLRYYEKLEKRMSDLGKKDENVKKELQKIEGLERVAEVSEKHSKKEFNNYRREVFHETQERYAKILGRLDEKINDIQVTLDNRDVVRRNESKHHKKKSTERKKEEEKVVNVSGSDEGFGYSYVLKHFISFSIGVAVVILYQRLTHLDDVIKHI